MEDSKELNGQGAENEGAAPELQPAPQQAPQAQQPAPQAAPQVQQPAPQPAPQVQQPAPQPAPQAQQPAPQPAPQAQQPAPQPAPQLQQYAPQPAPQLQQFAPQAATLAQQPAPQPMAQAQQPAPQPAPQYQQPAPQPVPQGQQQSWGSQGGASQGGAANEKNSVFGLMLKVLFSPGFGMEAVARERRIASAIVIVLFLSIFSAAIGTLGINQEDLREIMDFLEIYGEDRGFFVAMVRHSALIFGVAVAFLQVLFLFVRAGLYRLLGEMFGERKGYDGLTMVATLGYAAMPAIFSPVLNLISIFLGNFVLSMFFSLVICVWGAVLTVFAIKAALQCSGGKAFLIFIIPVLALLVTGVVSFTIFAFSMAFVPAMAVGW